MNMLIFDLIIYDKVGFMIVKFMIREVVLFFKFFS